IIVLFILTACNSNPSAEKLRSAKSENDLTKEELHQILLGRYQVIAGAWYVNKKCNFLSVKESENLEKHVGALNVYAQHNQLAPTEILLQMQKNAQFGASLPKYSSCGEEAKNMVKSAQQLSSMLYQDL